MKSADLTPQLETRIKQTKEAIAALQKREQIVYNELLEEFALYGNPDEPFLFEYIHNSDKHPTFAKYLKAYARLER